MNSGDEDMRDFEKQVNKLKICLMENQKGKWQELPLDSTPLRVGKQDRFIFEIRSREKNHMIPHFHVAAAEKSGSFSIYPVGILCSDFNNKENKLIIDWANQNSTLLVDKWNSTHIDNQICM